MSGSRFLHNIDPTNLFVPHFPSPTHYWWWWWCSRQAGNTHQQGRRRHPPTTERTKRIIKREGSHADPLYPIPSIEHLLIRSFVGSTIEYISAERIFIILVPKRRRRGHNMNESLLNSTRDLHLIFYPIHMLLLPVMIFSPYGGWKREIFSFLSSCTRRIFLSCCVDLETRTFFTHSLNRTNHTTNHPPLFWLLPMDVYYKRSLFLRRFFNHRLPNRVGLFELNKYMPTAYLSVFVVLPQSPCCFCPPRISGHVSTRIELERKWMWTTNIRI